MLLPLPVVNRENIMKIKNMSFSSRVVTLVGGKTLTLPARQSLDITEEEFRSPEIQRLFAEHGVILLPETQPKGGHDRRLDHSNRQQSQLAQVDSDAKEGAGRNDDQGPED